MHLKNRVCFRLLKGMFPISDDRVADEQYEEGWGLAETEAAVYFAKAQGTNSLISPHFSIKCVFVTLCTASVLRDQLITVQIQAYCLFAL